MSHVNERMRMRNSTAPAATTQTAKQMKEAAIEKAMKTTEKQGDSLLRDGHIKAHHCRAILQYGLEENMDM